MKTDQFPKVNDSRTIIIEDTEVSLRECTAEDIAEAYRVQREAFLRDGPPSLALRRNRMDRLSALTYEHRDALVEAIRLAIGRSRSLPCGTSWHR
jgi:acyl-CoA reductase-like NAD-dependent aldehyde dehydrogenase